MRDKLQIALGALMALSASLAGALKAASGGLRLEVYLSIVLAACGVGLVITGVLQRAEGPLQPRAGVRPRVGASGELRRQGRADALAGMGSR